MPDGEPVEQKKNEVSEEEEKPSDSTKKPLMMAASKPKGLPKTGPKPGGIGGIAGTSKPGGISSMISKCLEKPAPVTK